MKRLAITVALWLISGSAFFLCFSNNPVLFRAFGAYGTKAKVFYFACWCAMGVMGFRECQAIARGERLNGSD